MIGDWIQLRQLSLVTFQTIFVKRFYQPEVFGGVWIMDPFYKLLQSIVHLLGIVANLTKLSQANL